MIKRTDFAAIYSQWEKSHDEVSRINQRNSQDNRESVYVPTINEKRKMKVQDELDLHNVTQEVSVRMTSDFLRQSCERGLFKVRIVTGKGLHSPNGEAVIRPAVIRILENSSYVREFDSNPDPSDGGSGAVVVILRHSNKK